MRALPKRKYRKVKESTDTCSICLEEFREGETVRVLPCDHGEPITGGSGALAGYCLVIMVSPSLGVQGH